MTGIRATSNTAVKIKQLFLGVKVKFGIDFVQIGDRMSKFSTVILIIALVHLRLRPKDAVSLLRYCKPNLDDCYSGSELCRVAVFQEFFIQSKITLLTTMYLVSGKPGDISSLT